MTLQHDNRHIINHRNAHVVDIHEIHVTPGSQKVIFTECFK